MDIKKIGWGLFFVLVIYFIFLIRQDIIGQQGLRKDKAEAVRVLVIAEEKAREMNDRLARIKSNDLIEEIARTRLGMIKKGETAYKCQ
ncbi:MAG: septum formation initiator family protein [bacterium]